MDRKREILYWLIFPLGTAILLAVTSSQYASSRFEPHFSMGIYQIGGGANIGDPAHDSFIYGIAWVTNVGSPSVVRNWTLCVRVEGDMTYCADRLVKLTGTPGQLVGAGGEVLGLAQEDFLPDKAVQSPLPQGGEVTGYVFGVMHGLTIGELERAKCVVIVKCEDIKGKQYVAEQPVGVKPWSPLRAPGMRDVPSK